MAKSKTHDNVAQEALPVPATPAGNRFKRLAAVAVPTLKFGDSETIYVHIVSAIESKPKQIKKDDGTFEMGSIEVVSVVNLDTGEIMSLVCAAALSKNLKDYKGGNQQYVGLDFEVTKHPTAPGKKWKPYSIFEIDASAAGESKA